MCLFEIFRLDSGLSEWLVSVGIVTEPPNRELATAWRWHQAGRSADAARRYHNLLASQPDNADALHLFGVLHYQNGYFVRAVELIGRAAALQPETAAYHANLAEAHRALGQHQEAMDCCRTALRLQPDYPEAANNLGLALHALGRFAEAVGPVSRRPGDARRLSPWPGTTSVRPSASWASSAKPSRLIAPRSLSTPSWRWHAATSARCWWIRARQRKA